MRLPLILRQNRISTRLLLLLVLLGALAYSGLVGLLAGTGRMLLSQALLALPLAVGAAIFTVQRFRLVVLTIPIAALAIPFDLPTGTESKLSVSMIIVMGLTGIWCISMGLRGWKIAPSPLNKPMLVFGFICVLSLIWGIIWRDPILLPMGSSFWIVQVASLVCYLLSISAALLVGNFMDTPRRLKYLIGCFLVLCGLITIVKFFHLPQSFLNGEGLWALWLIAPAYGMLIAQPKLRWRWKLALIVLLALTIYQTLVLDATWLSGWVPGIAAIYAITFLRSRKAFFALLIVGAAITYASLGFFQEVAQENIDDGSLERLDLWEQNWQVVSQHWLLGTGPAGYAIYYMTYFREDARSTHNNYLDILAQFGFSGMLVWIWLAGASMWEGWKLSTRAPPGFLRTLAIVATGGWFGALVSMLFGDWVLPFAYNQTIGSYKYTVFSWLFLGTLISIRQLLAAQARSAAQPQPGAE